MTAADVKKHTVATLASVPPMKEHHGRDFYKYFFTTHPEHRTYYKGAENFNADDVEKSDRFDKLGNAILLHVQVLANVYDNEPVFRAFVGEVINHHLTKGLEPKLWKIDIRAHADINTVFTYLQEFWGYWKGFLENKGVKLSAEQKEAWDTLGNMFNEEAQAQLAKHGLPHV
ncbi:hypothetical protein Y032_0035g2967 [Ancylostoma ceylanicum]|uniref:Globin domain-containing protein n=1 Tax=Ancylostoma ceylanicum TaxID=53326 RepID=A0A016UKQ8_9BILA|nr:hypothetical protein Y032_0035g2967 [Ancylostoma ceylanicum]